MFCTSFLRAINDDLTKFNADKIDNWLPLNSIYPGILAQETVKAMVPHEKERFLSLCHNWYREAFRQILNRIDLTNPVFKALQSIHPALITDGKAAMDAAGTLASKLPLLAQLDIQTIDRQWRSLLIDLSILNGGWKDRNVISFWQSISNIKAHSDLGEFMTQATALPPSTACVESTFSKITKRNCAKNSSSTQQKQLLKSVSNFQQTSRLTNG